MGEQSEADAAQQKGSEAENGRTANTPSVLWEHDAVTCLCQRHGTYSVEIRLVLDDVVIQREFFADAESASQFALGKKRVYLG